MKKKPKLLIFDLDGTLILTGGAGSRSIDRLFLSLYGIGHALRGIDGRGKTDPAIVLEVFQKKLKRNPTARELQNLLSRHPRILKEEIKKSPNYREVGQVRGFLKIISKLPHVYLALGTGNIEEGARIKLAPARLNRYFPVGGFGTDSIDRKKLLLAAWRKAIRFYKVRFPKNSVYVIGDTPLDINAGRACSFKTVGISCGMYKKEELLKARPDFFFEDYSDPELWVEALEL